MDIGVVLVTYNRADKLKKALESYEKQRFKPKYIYVVNNNSTDSTADYLKTWESADSDIEHKVFSLEKNIGGSGGFHYGLSLAQDTDIDWVWLSDDDAYPDECCLEYMKNYILSDKEKDVSAICSLVWSDGDIDTWHRRRFNKKFGIIREERIDKREYEDNFELDLLSYVGVLIKKESLLSAGLTREEFFIAYDDSEHSIRLRKEGKIICIPKAVVVHDAEPESPAAVSWKKYYVIRNKIYSYRKHFGYIQSHILAWYYRLKNADKKALNEMTKKAVKAAFKGELGVDDLYKPGWK